VVRSKLEQRRSPLIISSYTVSAQVHDSKFVLRLGIALFRSKR
jgi:hypothetical protein